MTDIVVQYIQGMGDVNQVNICSYQSKNGVALDGWGFSGDDEMTTIDLFLTLYVDPEEGKKISDSELDRRFNWLQRFYDQSLSGNIFSKIEDADRMHEYYDYLKKPTRENATEFITQVLENNLDIIAKKKNYIDYLANRPRVEKSVLMVCFLMRGNLLCCPV